MKEVGEDTTITLAVGGVRGRFACIIVLLNRAQPFKNDSKYLLILYGLILLFAKFFLLAKADIYGLFLAKGTFTVGRIQCKLTRAFFVVCKLPSLFACVSRVSLEYKLYKHTPTAQSRLYTHIHRPTIGTIRYISSYCLANHPEAAPPLATTPKLPANHRPATAAATPLIVYHLLFFARSLSGPISVAWSGVRPNHFAHPHVIWKDATVINAANPANEMAGCFAKACDT